MNSSCVVYTALFDINRSSSDGRHISEYKLWLKQTAALFDSMVIFHDGCLDNLDIENTLKIRMGPSDLYMFSYEAYVQGVIEKSKVVSKNDITFKNAKYSLVQYAKFELAIKAMEIAKAESALWVDAGISRFIGNYSSDEQIQESGNALLQGGYEMRLEVDLRMNVKLPSFTLATSPVGTCKRVISGTSFWISRDYSGELLASVINLLEIWRQNEVWDNEQVLLRTLEPWKNHKVYFDIQGRNLTGSVSRDFLNISKLRMKIRNSLVHFLVSRSVS